MAGAVETLTAEQVAEVEALAGLGLGTNLPSLIPPAPRQGAKKTVITYDELLDLRSAGISMVGLYVRLTRDGVTGLVEASKVSKWTNQGWTPA